MKFKKAMLIERSVAGWLCHHAYTLCKSQNILLTQHQSMQHSPTLLYSQRKIQEVGKSPAATDHQGPQNILVYCMPLGH